MKKYESPMILAADGTAEAVYLASGASADSGEKVRCKFGRTEASRGVDKCQVCSANGGLRDTAFEGEHYYKENYQGCPEGLPEK